MVCCEGTHRSVDQRQTRNPHRSRPINEIPSRLFTSLVPMEAIVPFVFAFAAVFGIGMAVAHFRGKTTPQAIGVLHGVFALSGIAILLFILLDAEASVGNGWLILGLFGLAALG